MKKLLTLLFAMLTAATLTLTDAEAKRFGFGKSLGRQSQSMFRQSPKPAPVAPSRTGQSGAVGGQPRPSGASRWLGPLAGLAAGGLLASLFFGDAFEGVRFMDILLLAGLVFGGMMLFRAMRGGARQRPVGAGPHGSAPTFPHSRGGMVPEGPGSGSAHPSGQTPAWFDADSFIGGAKHHFVSLQAAWDKGDFAGIRDYVTPELYTELEREWVRSGATGHHTEVLMLDAELVELVRDGDQVVASVHFSGMIREDESSEVDDLSEVWHVLHRWDSPEGDWRIAGIQQLGGEV